MNRSGLYAAPALALALVAFAPAVAVAGHGEVLYAPRMGVKPKSGLSLAVDTTWVSGNGYRPVRVTVAPMPAGPAAADRVLRIELSPRDYYGFDNRLTAGQTLELPEGAASAETVIAVPESQTSRKIKVEVFEDGEKLEDLSFTAPLTLIGSVRYGDDGAPSILIIDADAPTPMQRGQVPAGTNDLHDFRTLASLHPNGPKTTAPPVPGMAPMPPTAPAGNVALPPGYVLPPADDKTLLFELFQCPNIEMLPPASLSERWIDYSSVDIAFVSFGDFVLLRDGHPKKWSALRNWLAAGGTLCVFDMGASGERLDRLSRMLDLPVKKHATGGGIAWEAPGEQPWNPAYQFFASGQGDYAYDENGQQITPEEVPFKPVAGLKFVTRDVEFGKVAAIANETPFPGGAPEWGQLFNAVGPSRWTWYQRHGVSLTSVNQDYWDFLIPGVGLPPVNAFRVLITLFAVVVGPVNYVVLKRKKRLNYLLLTVPVGALLVTAGLFLYALVSDGLGVRSRVRSITELDQRRDRAVSWSRQSYYASLTPSQGLAFPENAAVYQILPDGENLRNSPQRDVEWGEGKQQLARGYLRPRSLAQFLVLHCNNDAKSELAVKSEDGKLKIENRLGARIQLLWLVDAKGQSYFAEDIGDGQARSLKPKPAGECQPLLQDAVTASTLRPPEGFNPAIDGRTRFFGSYYYGMGRYTGLPDASQRGGLLEKSLSQFSAQTFRPEPGSYVAIVDESAETPMGVASAKSDASFHVILGKW